MPAQPKARSAARSQDIMDRFFDGRRKYVYDDFPHEYYREQGSEYKERAKAQVRAAFAAVKSALGDRKGIYLPCAISGGIEGHKLAYTFRAKFAEADQKLTTVKLGEFTGSEIVGERVFGPNTDKNLTLSRDAQAQYPKDTVIAPAGLQAMVHSFGANPGFSRGQKWEEDDYMALWFPVMTHFINKQVLRGDWNFSRGANWEIMFGASVQAGLVPERPKADMDVVNDKGRPVTLGERIEAVSNFVRWGAPKGFDVSVAVTTMARLIHMSEQVEAAKAGQDSIITASKMHRTLKKRSAAELEQIEGIKAAMGPFIAQHVPDQLNSEGLGNKWAREFLAGKKGVAPATELQDTIPFDHGTQKAGDAKPFAGFERRGPEAQLYQLDGDYFGKKGQSRLFEDDHYARLTERERLILPFLMAATETGMAPADQPHVALVLGDPKTGRFALDKAEMAGLDDIAELPGVAGREFSAVARKNVRELDRTAQMLRRQFKTGLVMSSADFDRMFDAAAEQGHGVVAPGPDKVGSLARAAFRNKMIDRRVDRVVAMDGWEQSPSYVQHMVRATLVQAGVVPRQNGSGQDVMVFDQRGNEMSLLDRIKPLATFVEKAIDRDVAVPEQSLALARLLEFYDRQVDPDYRKRMGVAIDAQATNPAINRHVFGGEEATQLREIRERLRPKLIEHAARHFDESRIDGLNQDYWKARQIRVARDDYKTRRRPGDATHITPSRPSRI